MYSTLLALHSLIRWFVLASLLLAIFQAYRGWFSEKPFSRLDNSIRYWTVTVVHTQLLLGIWIYFISPIVSYFLSNFPESVHNQSSRFFGMEHSTVMLAAVIVITIGSAKTKRKQSDNQKFKTMAIWFTLGLLLVLSSIPWSFSPFASRPSFRPF